MREEALKPLPVAGKCATLLLGRTRVACYIVESTKVGFLVAVPGIDQYEGDPKLTLATEEGVYRVRLVLQERLHGGYSYRLKRMNFTNRTNTRGHLTTCLNFLTSRDRASEIVAVVMVCCLCIPIVNDAIPLLRLRGFPTEILGWRASSAKQNENGTSGHHHEQLVAINDVSDQDALDANDDFSTISVSMISAAAWTDPQTALQPLRQSTNANVREDGYGQSGGKSLASVKRRPSLKSLLEAGQAGRLQTIGQSDIPWLFGSDSSDTRISLRTSDAALFDLKIFEIGLRRLPMGLSSRAIVSLRKTLLLANAHSDKAQRVSGLPDVFVIASDDANVYFRTVRGRVELVRVLPIDFNKTE